MQAFAHTCCASAFNPTRAKLEAKLFDIVFVVNPTCSVSKLIAVQKPSKPPLRLQCSDVTPTMTYKTIIWRPNHQGAFRLHVALQSFWAFVFLGIFNAFERYSPFLSWGCYFHNKHKLMKAAMKVVPDVSISSSFMSMGCYPHGGRLLGDYGLTMNASQELKMGDTNTKCCQYSNVANSLAWDLTSHVANDWCRIVVYVESTSHSAKSLMVT